MSQQKEISESLALIFQGINRLRSAFKGRQFTIDGRLVGDIGEVIACLNYDVDLDETSQPGHDGTTSDGRRVQIKATFQDQLTFKTVPDYYLGLKLKQDGTYEEVYNGPGKLISEHYSHRKGIGQDLLRFPNSDLRDISKRIQASKRIPKRTSDSS